MSYIHVSASYTEMSYREQALKLHIREKTTRMWAKDWWATFTWAQATRRWATENKLLSYTSVRKLHGCELKTWKGNSRPFLQLIARLSRQGCQNLHPHPFWKPEQARATKFRWLIQGFGVATRPWHPFGSKGFGAAMWGVRTIFLCDMPHTMRWPDKN